MARIALTVGGFAAGSFLGHPELGAMLGSLAGGLLFPTNNKGPRLSDLQVISSANGVPVPWGYGTFRVGGNVIWCPGLVENIENKKTLSTVNTTYHYYASFACGFASGPAQVLRIWGDTKVVYEAGGPSFFPSKWFVVGSAVGWAGGICGAFTDVLGNLIEAFWVGHGTTVTVPDRATVMQLGINNNYQAISAGGFPLTVSLDGGPPQQVYVPAQAVPWEVVGFENITYPFGDVGGSAPVIALQNLLAGQTVAIAAEPDGSGGYLGQITLNSNAATDAEGRSTGNTVNWYGPDGDTNEPTGTMRTAPPASIYPEPEPFPGSETQGISELIQADKGVDITPAFRGLCYVVWENFPLANFGNRIPTLRAELAFNAPQTTVPVAPVIIQSAFTTSTSTEEGGYGVPVIATMILDSPPTAGNLLVFMISGWGAGAFGQRTVPSFSLDVGSPNGDIGYEGFVGMIGACWRTVQPGDGISWTFDISNNAGPVNFLMFEVAGAGTPEIFEDQTVAATTLQLTMVAWDSDGPSSLVGITPLGESEIIADDWNLPPFNYPAILIDGITVFESLSPPLLDGIDLGSAFFGSHGASLPLAMDYSGATSPESPVFFHQVSSTILLPLGNPLVAETSTGGLDQVVLDICLRSGLAAAQVDVSRLIGQSVIGYVLARPTTGAAVLKALAGGYFFDAAEIDGKLAFVPRGQSSLMTIPESDLGLYDDHAEFEEEMGQEQDLPREVQVVYADPAIDYQQNKQLKRRNASVVKTKNQNILEIPYALDADIASSIAEKALFLSYLERRKFTINLWKALYSILTPTDVIQFVGQGVTEQIRLVKTTEGAGRAIAVQAVSEMPNIYLSVASGGRTQKYAGGSNAPLVAATMMLFDVPLLQDSDNNPGGTGYYFGFSAPAGWSGAVIYASVDGSTFSQENSGHTALNIGTAASILAAPASPWSLDAVNTLTIQGLSAALANATLTQLTTSGVNSLLVGDELLQFTTATQNSDGSWTVSGLLRGRRGTDGFCGTHVASESVIVLGSEGFSRQLEPTSALNQLRYYRGVSNGQTLDAVSSQNLTLVGRDLMPYSPVNIGGSFDATGNLTVTWTRRTRLGGGYGVDGFSLTDGLNGPVSEQSESYEIDIVNSGGTAVRTFAVATPTAVYPRADQITDFGALQSGYDVRVYQISATVGRGFPGAATVPVSGAAINLPAPSGLVYIN